MKVEELVVDMIGGCDDQLFQQEIIIESCGGLTSPSTSTHDLCGRLSPPLDLQSMAIDADEDLMPPLTDSPCGRYTLDFGINGMISKSMTADEGIVSDVDHCFGAFDVSGGHYETKAETASIKSDTGSGSGHESDARLELNHTTGADSPLSSSGCSTAGDSTSSDHHFKLSKAIGDKILSSLATDSNSEDNCSDLTIKTSGSSSSGTGSTTGSITGSTTGGNSYCCKWTHCDWPGAYDDLVDHIREIHVELQPYQQQRHNWSEQAVSHKSKAKSSTISSTTTTTTSSGKTSNSDRNNGKSLDSTSGSSSGGHSPTKKSVESTQQYVCLWEGCKVYGKSSLSRNWLERHVLEQHSGPRPFKCIVEGCGARFKVQSALERHVNSHFKPCLDYANSNCSSDVMSCCPNGSTSCCVASSTNNSDMNGQCMSSSSSAGLSAFELHLQQSARATTMSSVVRCKTSTTTSATTSTTMPDTGHNCQHFCCGCSSLNGSTNGTPNKILKRKKSATKLKRKCIYVKCSEDYFDDCVMEKLRYGLIQLADKTGLDIGGNGGSSITFHSKVIARRENHSGEVNVLLKWEPNNILPDVWVPECEVSGLKTKSVPMSTIPLKCLAQLIEESTGFESKPKIKQRRK